MKAPRNLLFLPAALLLVAVAPAQGETERSTDASAAPAAGELFDKVVKTLSRRYWDRTFRREKLPVLAAQFRPAALAATSLDEECAIVDGLLAKVPSSHLALYTQKAVDGMMAELMGRRRYTLGFQIKQRASAYFACKILEGGPADRAGIKRGDRVVSIDGESPQASARRGRRSDDAYLDDAPLHALHVAAKESEVVTFVIERKPGERTEIAVESARYSALLAAKESARIIESGGKRLGYVHFWYIHSGCVALLKKLFTGEFADCDALILDLRGRGGNALEAHQISRLFTAKRKRWPKPFVALMDKESRSAKEMLAYEFSTKKVGAIIGERSAGALVPAQFEKLGQGMVLMYPGRRLGKYSEHVELIGVEPDIKVAYPLPYTAGADPILERAVTYLSR